MVQPPFRALTVKYGGLSDRIITEVRITEPFDPRNPPAQPPKEVVTGALWDTGASRSAITPSVIASLGLQPIGTRVVNHFGGSSTKPTYLVNVDLRNGVGFPCVVVAECDVAEHFGFILGMEIMTKGDLAITNAHNQTWLSFRIPSMGVIDYVQEFNKIQFAGLGRNDLCRCGKTDASGKRLKFKKCHGGL